MAGGKRRKESLTLYLERDQVERLRQVSAVTKVPMSVYIRDGVDLVLAKLRSELRIWDENGDVKVSAQ